MNEIYTMSMMVSILVFILSTHITPGPTNIILLSSIFSHGYRKSVPFMLGCVFSYPLLMLLSGLGVASFLVQFPSVMMVLKVFGVGYLCWMAWCIAVSSTDYENEENDSAKIFGFKDAFVYTLFNVKAWIIYISAISLFVVPTHDNLSQISVIVLITLISMIITVYSWGFGAVILKRFITNQKLIRALNVLMAILLVVSIMPLVI